VPIDNELVASEACPEPFRVAVAIVVPPSLNVIVPVGVPPVPVTLALNVTAVPGAAGFGVALSVVEDAVAPPPPLIWSETTDDVLDPNVASPP
jgi:hypothetical protein